MKKIILSIMIAVICFVNTNAQTTKFGVKAGANLACITDKSKEVIDGKSTSDKFTSIIKIGIYFGVLADIEANEKLHIQPEFMFSSEGNENAAFNYLKLPLMVKYYLEKGLNVQAGPELSYLLTVDGESDFSDDFNKLNLNANLGLAYDFDNNFIVDVRYNLPITTVFESKETINGDTFEVKSKQSNFQVGVGYKF